MRLTNEQLLDRADSAPMEVAAQTFVQNLILVELLRKLDLLTAVIGVSSSVSIPDLRDQLRRSVDF